MKIITVDEIGKAIYNSSVGNSAWHPDLWPHWEDLEEDEEGGALARLKCLESAKEILELLQKKLGDLKLPIENFKG